MQIKDVAFVGYMRAGKDSVADCLLHLNRYAWRVSFADALKQEVADALNSTAGENEEFSVSFFNRDENRPLYRPLLQWWGTEYRRGQQADYWVRQVEAEIDRHRRDPSRVLICTDARFLNEISMLHDRGFTIIKLDMDVQEVHQHLSAKGMNNDQIRAQLAHPSEQEWQQVKPDYTFPSRFGNLPRLTRQTIEALTGDPVNANTIAEIGRFYMAKYPQTYGIDKII